MLDPKRPIHPCSIRSWIGSSPGFSAGWRAITSATVGAEAAAHDAPSSGDISSAPRLAKRRYEPAASAAKRRMRLNARADLIERAIARLSGRSGDLSRLLALAA